MRTRLSICRKKKRYRSEGDAIASARRDGLRLRPYRCDRCGQFHLTSRTKGKRVPPHEREAGFGVAQGPPGSDRS